MRPARSDEVMRLWPAVKAARLMASAEAFSAFRDAGPWRVQVTESGEALVVAPWRGHLDVLAIRGLWAARHRVPELVEAAASIARAQGFASVLSPLVALADFEPYRKAGMRERERLVALQAATEAIAARGTVPDGVCLRPAASSDVADLVALDAQCFDDFWRYGEAELAEALIRERVMIAEDRAGIVAGYASCARYGRAATLGRLAVAPGWQRQGIGAALCAAVARWAHDGDADYVSLCTQDANTGSRALYSYIGFTEIKEPFTLGERAV